MRFYSESLRRAAEALETDPDRGLTAQEAARRLAQYGENQLRQAKPPSLLLRCLGQLKDPMILVLLAAAALSFFAGGGQDWLDAAIILLIVVFNTVISVSQEDNARKALEALRQLSSPKARVLRDGTESRIESTQLVPGDVILLEAGDYVPADGRIWWQAGLQTDESAMTGESLPVHKRGGSGLPPETPLAERKNMVIGGTAVTGGRAKVLVTDTGMETEMGKIAGLLLDQAQGETPLQRKMGEVSRVLSLVCVGVCAVMFGLGALQHRDLLDMFLTAVALAVAAIPEGLPAIVTIVLAMGVGRMAKQNAIIKRLPAVETLGCASVICSDKTGTLTKNQMTVLEVWTPGGSLRRRALTLGTLCGDARKGPKSYLGDPTETAIADLADQEGLPKAELDRENPRQGEAPFDSSRKRMATCHSLPGGGTLIAVKGAPEAVLAKCTHILGSGGPRPLGAGERASIQRENSRLAGRALRVLAVAQRETRGPVRDFTPEELERDRVFVGLIGMMDPPRPEVRQAVDRCAQAGIRPVMITGDHRDTAVAIARDLGIYRPGDRAVDGRSLDLLPQETLEEEIDRFSVFARVTPEHKMRIVKAWQKRGHVVAMTGDGVNDAPALKTADIGCAMGRTGTDVAKGAADMILTDDNFATVVSAVEQGRGIYANIRKAIHYLLSCNIGEILTIFLATLLCFPHAPLSPVQLLWLNLVTDSLPALALGMEPVEEAVMEQPPRGKEEPLFSKAFSFRLAWQGALVGGLTLLAYNLGLRDSYGAANTMAFAALTLCQLFHAFDVRSEETSLFHLGVFSNAAMNKAFLAGLALQLAVLLLPPLQGAFSVEPMTLEQWGMVFALAVTPLVVCEIEKAARRHGRKKEHKREKETIKV
ncbi:calcium-translocating P-type ATPase, PMCA-type [Evtepia sp.]|uniref:calcium-translocating P-type ATPase, PMCA-type n=1 Tax=Evtepia sp. TaxID=2773933 RepID=UPI002A7F1BDD|nr:calcium-translocating P-type ATPase, PMCA-type [Evtepia sp.]MDY4430626.1 calcium-translocating P-type ATPase, PMCA-type [Evtepia sp.]